jgi:amidase
MTHLVPRDISLMHCAFDPAIPPVVTVQAGESVTVQTANAFALLPSPETAEFAEAVQHLDLGRGNPLSGPIAVAGAAPGDTVVIHIDAITVDSDHGLSPVLADVGLLKDRVKPPHVGRFPIRDGHVELAGGLRSELRPNLGVLGVTPPERAMSVHAGRHGGNLDDQRLGAGSRVYLPVLTPGAGISFGDVHGIQGDAEWRAPIEVDATVELTVERVIKGVARDLLWTETPTHWVSYGIEGGIWDSIEGAANRMVDFLSEKCEMSAADALVVLSSVADVRLCSVPGEIWSAVVRAELPKAIDPAGRLTFD